MDAPKFNAREELARCQDARDAVREQHETAIFVHECGSKLVQTTAAHLAQCKERRDAAQAELSTRIAERLRAGKTPELDNAPLARSEQEIGSAHTQHLAAQRAVERLAADLESARVALMDAQGRVRAAAVAVLADDAELRSTELRKARAIVSEHETWLRAAAALPLGVLGRGLLPAVSVAMEIPSFNPAAEAGLQRRVRAYLAALELDSTSAWDAIAEPPPPTPISFKPSSAVGDQKNAA